MLTLRDVPKVMRHWCQLVPPPPKRGPARELPPL